MSRDIRSYFQTNSKSKVANISPKSKDVKTKSKKRVIVIDSDSDDDQLFPSFSSKRTKTNVEPASKKKEKPSPQLKPVSVSDVLGNELVKRSVKTVSPAKVKESVSDLQNSLLENDFDAPWDKIDELESKYFKNSESKPGKSESIVSTPEANEKQKANPSATNILKRSPNKVDSPSGNKKHKAVDNIHKSVEKHLDSALALSSDSDGGSKSAHTPKQEKKIDVDQIASSEKKKGNAANYFKYLHREGPKHPGSKEVPNGKPNCFAGLVFVVTGVLDSLDREEAASIIKKYGGRVTQSVSRNTSYIVVGEDAGPAKLEKAKSFHIEQLNEDGLLNLIIEKSKTNTSGSSVDKKISKNLNFESKVSKSAKLSKKEISHRDIKEETLIHNDCTNSKGGSIKKQNEKDIVTRINSEAESSLWVDRYRPKSLKQIIGQQGDKSVMNKLLKWLSNWHKNQSGGKKNKPSPWAKDDDGGYFKAALLSGPPGIGKTTTAHLVSNELGFDIVEFNASDTRSKKLLHDEISELLSSKSLYGYFHHSSKSQPSEKHVLIMDEVDGMAGNEDRGGIQELIQLIKHSRIPIICMCNDRNHPKIRSLVNYCFDLRVNKPRVEQIRGAMMSICFKEGLKLPPDALTEIITAANQDLRQVLHHLSVMSANSKNLSLDEVKQSAQRSKKEFKLGPWDVLKKVFSAADHKSMNIHDKSDLFFHDYSISPLFVQENYLSVVPLSANGKINSTLELISKTADSISMGDIIEKTMRSSNSWNLLPVQAMFSSVIPGEYMSGYLQSQINFPAWLGKNSRTNKFDRLTQELQVHMRLGISGSKKDLCLDYLSHLKDAIVKPLIQDGADGVPSVLKTLQDYYLTREDIESILELSTWPNQKDPMSGVESKVKAALTRAYNKSGITAPYSVVSVVKKKAGGSADIGEDEEEHESDNDSGDDIATDAMIKVKKPSTKKADQPPKQTENKRGKGRGRGKTKV